MKRLFFYIYMMFLFACVVPDQTFGDQASKVDIFIKSYQNDFKWLRYCIRSIKKNVKNLNRLIIVIPLKDLDVFDIDLPNEAILHTVEERGEGYLYQQYVKMMAYRYSSADFIMFVDSDCVFTRQVDLQDLIKNNKPIICMTKYTELVDAQGKSIVPWQEPTEKVFERPIMYEFMRRNFLIFHRSTLENFKNWFKHDLESYILSNQYFSEFNVLGAFAYIYETNRYHFIDNNYPPLDYGKQFWSYSSMTASEREELEQIVN